MLKYFFLLFLQIKEKCENYKNAKEELEFTTNYYSKFRDKFFTFVHDKFLIWSSNSHGFGKIHFLN